MILYHTLTLDNVIAPAIHKPKTEHSKVQFHGGLSIAVGISALAGLVHHLCCLFSSFRIQFLQLVPGVLQTWYPGSSPGCPEDAKGTGMSCGTGFYINGDVNSS